MITAGDFKKGITIEWDGGVWNIVDFQHVKPGKGAADPLIGPLLQIDHQ